MLQTKVRPTDDPAQFEATSKIRWRCSVLGGLLTASGAPAASGTWASPRTARPGSSSTRSVDNLARAYDLVDYARERYMAMSPDDHWVAGARATDIDDAAFEAALPDSSFRSWIPELIRRAHTFLHDPTVRPQP